MKKDYYDYKDAKGYERGGMGNDRHGKQRPNGACIYHLTSIDHATRIAHVEAHGAWGNVYNNAYPLHTITPLEPKQDLK